MILLRINNNIILLFLEVRFNFQDYQIWITSALNGTEYHNVG